MNQNKLLYNIVKIAGSVANPGTNYKYYDFTPGIREAMAYRYGQQLGKDQRAEQKAKANAARYVREGRMTPDEAQRRLDARNKQNYQFDMRYLDAISDYPTQKNKGFSDTRYSTAHDRMSKFLDLEALRKLKPRLGPDKPLI